MHTTRAYSSRQVRSTHCDAWIRRLTWWHKRLTDRERSHLVQVAHVNQTPPAKLQQSFAITCNDLAILARIESDLLCSVRNALPGVRPARESEQPCADIFAALCAVGRGCREGVGIVQRALCIK